MHPTAHKVLPETGFGGVWETATRGVSRVVAFVVGVSTVNEERRRLTKEDEQRAVRILVRAKDITYLKSVNL